MTRSERFSFLLPALLAALLLAAAAWPAGAQTPIKLGYIPSKVEPGTTDPENAPMGMTSSGSIIAGSSYDYNSGIGHAAAWVWEVSNPTVTPLPLPAGYTDSELGGFFESGGQRVINDAGQIVGTCKEVTSEGDLARHACLWQKDSDGVWTVRVLGTLPGHQASEAWTVNASGQVTGTSWTNDPSFQLGFFIWDNEHGMRALNARFRATSAISDTGLVAGMKYEDDGPNPEEGWIWDTLGTDTDAGSLVLTIENGNPMAVSPSGVVAGIHYDANSEVSDVFLWRPGDQAEHSLAALPVVKPDSCPSDCTMRHVRIETLSVNDAGQVLFSLETAWISGPDEYYSFDFYFWNGTAFVGLASTVPGQGIVGAAMNGNGQVVIHALDPSYTYSRAYLWNGTGMAQLVPPLQDPLLGTSSSYFASLINDAGQMAGQSDFETTTGGFPANYATAWGMAGFGINNIPANAAYGGQFTPTYDYSGDGKTSATTSTPDVCALGRGGVVKFVGVGTCTLTAHAAAGATSPAMDGAPQSFSVGKGAAAITIKNLPKNAAYGDKFNPTYAFTGDGVKSVTSNTPDVCEPAKGGVKFVGVGACELVAHIAEGAHYLAGDGTPQFFAVGKAPTTISINNIPKDAKAGGSFVPTFKYSGDGVTSVTSGTLKVCTVSGGTVNFIAGGPCKLTAHAAEGTLYLATDGKAQSFPVAK